MPVEVGPESGASRVSSWSHIADPFATYSGYARVLAKNQHLDTQLAQVQAGVVDRMVQEKISGATIQRRILTELLATLRAEDTVTVARSNRLGRNSARIVQLVAELHARQVCFVTLDLGIDTAIPASRCWVYSPR